MSSRKFGIPSPPPIKKDPISAAVPAYPSSPSPHTSEKVEFSFKKWDKNWADLAGLKNVLKKLPEIIFKIQAGDMRYLMKSELVKKVKNPEGLKRVKYKGDSLYEIRPRYSNGPERIFFELAYRTVDGGNKKLFAYILWIDPKHKICH